MRVLFHVNESRRIRKSFPFAVWVVFRNVPKELLGVWSGHLRLKSRGAGAGPVPVADEKKHSG
jgi:hypothetical protein